MALAPFVSWRPPSACPPISFLPPTPAEYREHVLVETHAARMVQTILDYNRAAQVWPNEVADLFHWWLAAKATAEGRGTLPLRGG